jgi:U3 small nucleolar RNA-associated protein 7
MFKKEVKEQIQNLKKAVDENATELKTLDILKNNLPNQLTNSHSNEFIMKNINLYTAEKSFNISLENGPYSCTYTRNGSNMLVYSKNGYLSSFNTQKLNLNFESNLNDKIHDAKWFHNELYFGVAQEDCVFVYDNLGTELHAVRDMKNTKKLEYLPYHFLLAGSSNNGHLNYLDTSIGEIISSLFISEKNPTVLKSNPTNGIIHLGTPSGIVSLWAPSQKSYLMKIKCHKSNVSNIEIDRSGINMITTGNDNKIHVFDIRNTYKPKKTVPVKTNIHFTSLSDRNLLAIGYSDRIAILKDFEEIYISRRAPGIIQSLEFCKHEDILSIGHKNGFSTIVIPGSGDPMYDTNEDSPFVTIKERKNLEVKKLLEKIPFDLISLNQIIGTFDKNEIKDQNKIEIIKNDCNKTALSRFYK